MPALSAPTRSVRSPPMNRSPQRAQYRGSIASGILASLKLSLKGLPEFLFGHWCVGKRPPSGIMGQNRQNFRQLLLGQVYLGRERGESGRANREGTVLDFEY